MATQQREAQSRPRVSIIIPVFNNLELTRQCLEAIQKTAGSVPHEIIVVDNASTDGTADFLLKEQAEGQLRTIGNNVNLGFAKACNQGAKGASSDYLLFLNNDTEPQPNWIEPLMEVLDSDHSVAAVGSRLLFPDGTIQHAGVIVINDRKLPDPLVARHIYYRQPATLPEANQMRTYQVLTAACLLVRKSAFEEVGGFDEGYWNGYEDVDLCFKFQEMGWKLVYQPESTLIHYEAQSGAERFKMVSNNIARLHNKWLQKIIPDIIIERDGSVKQTDVKRITPYVLPKTAESGMHPISPGIRMVSIIILTYNQLEYTKKCVESIKKYTQEPHEIIVVDNGSTDETLAYVRKLLKTRPNIRVIANASNRGFAKGNNQGISIAKGAYILLLNNDTMVTPGWLSRMLDVFTRHPETGIVGPMSNSVSGPQLIPDVYYGNMDELDAFAVRWSGDHDAQSFPLYRVVGFCLLTKREVIDRIGGLDEQFGSGNFEDDDFCNRAALAGYEARVAEDVYIHHTGSQTFIGAGIDYKKSLLSNWELFKTKWGIPIDTPYEKGYNAPLQPPPELNLYIPLPDVSIDHRAADSNNRWLKDVSSKEMRSKRSNGMTSIIVLTSAQFAHTKNCIKSLRKNTPERHEIIIADNGFSPKTTGWLRQQANESKDIRLISNPPSPGLSEITGMSGGYAKACNQGISESSGEYIAVLTDDVVVSKGWLSGMLECLNVSSDTGIVGPMTTNVEGPQNVLKTDYSSPDKLDPFAGAFRERYRYRRVPSRYLAGCCMLFRHELLEKTGLFDDSFDSNEFAADDFCFRAVLEGYRNVIAADVFVHHYADTSSQGKKAGAAALSRQKKDLFIRKWSKTDDETALKLSLVHALQTANEMSQRGMLDQAVGALMDAIKLNANEKRLYYTLVEILMDNMKFAEAQEVLQNIPERMRQESRWFELAAQCSTAMQSYREAEEYADKVLAINNALPAALNIKGLVALNKGLNAEAEKFFERALKTDRGFAEAYTNIGRIKWPSNQEAAFTLFEKAFILSPVLSDVATHYYNAVVSLSRFERAEAFLRDAAALYPMNKRLRSLLKDMLLRTGRYGEAEEANIEFV